MKISWQQIEPALANLEPVTGGFTSAERGIVTLDSGQKLFVKRAVDEQTAAWIKLEKRAYHWLAAHGYEYAPLIIAESDDGFALPDLSHRDWSNKWTTEKLNAALRAMKSLAALSSAVEGTFEHYDDINHWLNLPTDAEKYKGISDHEAVLEYVNDFLVDGPKRLQLTALSDNHPERGETLVHLDVRADNFCYDPETRRGYLVDWNWLCLASEALDVNGLLVSVAQRGFDVLSYDKDQLDGPSLANLAGFWLNSALQPEDDPQAGKRHRQQFQAAVTALRLYEQIL